MHSGKRSNVQNSFLKHEFSSFKEFVDKTNIYDDKLLRLRSVVYDAYGAVHCGSPVTRVS